MACLTMTEIMKLLLEAKERIADTCGVPETMLMRRSTARTFAEVYQRQQAGEDLIRQRANQLREGFIAPVYAGMKVITSDYMPKRLGIYAGSFDPFHKGHKSIVEDALPLFDKVIVMIAANNAKPVRRWSMAETLGMVTDFRDGRESIEVGMMNEKASPGQMAADLGNAFLIRGIREITDMDYERRLATFNRELFGVQTVFIFARAELAHINGTAIREMDALGLGYERYL
jgi:pantetheine-phosphate adenylyltransferase